MGILPLVELSQPQLSHRLTVCREPYFQTNMDNEQWANGHKYRTNTHCAAAHNGRVSLGLTAVGSGSCPETT